MHFTAGAAHGAASARRTREKKRTSAPGVCDVSAPKERHRFCSQPDADGPEDLPVSQTPGG